MIQESTLEGIQGGNGSLQLSLKLKDTFFNNHKKNKKHEIFESKLMSEGLYETMLTQHLETIFEKILNDEVA